MLRLFALLFVLLAISGFAQNSLTFNRNNIVTNLKQKITNNQPLVIHVFVPLCDNKYQGIAKVGAKLGDGRNLNTNLYWGAGYGLKTWFVRNKAWKHLESKFNIDSFVLERAVFYRTFPNKANVYLVLDAYKGDKMEKCISDFFMSLAGMVNDTILIKEHKIPVYGKSDLLIFNGHNGLMDSDAEIFKNTDNREKDAVVIACFSYNYFINHLIRLKSYPLITTTNFLPPEAYIVSAIIDNWAMLQTGDAIRIAAGKAMAGIHKLPESGCIKTFKTGW